MVPRTLILSLWLAVVGATALAQDLPALLDVRGVASNDVLNIRAAPSAKAQILGALAPNARVEGLAQSEDGRWIQVNAGETSGWASARFLARRPHAGHETQAMQCFGTEPFWDVTLNTGSDGFTAAGSPQAPLTWVSLVRSANRSDRWAWRADDGSLAMLRLSACSDGMSDRAYGLSVDLIRDGALLSGCCSLDVQ